MRDYRSVFFCVLLVPGMVLAQQGGGQSGQQQQPPPEQQQQQQQPPEQQQQQSGQQFLTTQGQNQVMTDQLVGNAVVNQQNEEIGSINQLIITQDGQIAAVVVGVGGFLGIGEKNVAVSWDQLQITQNPETQEMVASVNMDRQQLEDAPEFARRDSGQGGGGG